MGKGKSHKYIPKGKKGVSKEASKKEQGEMASPKARGRSLGSEYAYAVEGLLEQAKAMRGSDASFLGKEKKVINPKECVSEKMLYKKKKK